MGTRRIPKVLVTASRLCAAFACVGLLSASALVAQNNPGKAQRGDFTAANNAPTDPDALNKLLAGLPQVTFDDNGTPRRFYVWEGDMLLDSDDVQAMMFAHRVRQAPAHPGELLLQVRPDGQSSVWRRSRRSLTYFVDCSTFPSASQCDVVQQAMSKAGDAWTSACTRCGVTFRKVGGSAGALPSDAASGPRFVVRYDPNATDYLAISFFANDPAYKRFLYVTPGYFTTSFDRVGILRHELGHVLGYRHEHNRALTGCYFEDRNWVPLTEYDPHSVMHYFCGGGGTMKLALTATDIRGHVAAYSH